MAAPITRSSPTGFDLDVDVARRILQPRGQVDAATAPIVLDAAHALMARAVGDLTLDLAQITSADSALLHTLAAIRTRLRAQGAGLWLVNEPPCVQRLLLANG